jgi:ubiquinone/menaquinone biosynthesis C-methylase UbiE
MSIPSNYVLGQSTYEQERLMLQARVLRPYTERFFRAAGLWPGMRVLDLGSGVGDVAFLVGDIVGPRGGVVGLDRDPLALDRARQRAVELGCSSWVSFKTTKLEDFTTSDVFDAVVGRYVLLYQPNPAATLRQMAQFLRPGGIVAFHEVDFSLRAYSYPPCELADQLVALIPEAFRRMGLPADFGRRLGRTYLDAGLPFPAIAAEIPVSGGTGAYVYSWVANTVVSLSPRFQELGLAMPPGVAADDTLAARLEEAVVAGGSQTIGPTQFGAWCRKPL